MYITVGKTIPQNYMEQELQRRFTSTLTPGSRDTHRGPYTAKTAGIALMIAFSNHNGIK